VISSNQKKKDYVFLLLFQSSIDLLKSALSKK